MPPAKKTAKKTTKKTIKKTLAKRKGPVKKSVSEKKGDTKKNKKIFEPIRGMKDLVPKDEKYWLAIWKSARELARAYSYNYIETPIIEPTQLFVRSIGKGTDVVDKEMYTFDDRDGNKVSMRPEFTAGIARSFISNGMMNMPQPVKLWTRGPLFRYDRPQAGRYRQFHQFGCEVIGDRDPVIDAELISIGYNFYRDLGINTEVYINSIGSLEDRQNYTIELVGYLRSKRSYLSDLSKKRLTKSPLRILDSKDEQDREVLQDAPQIIEWLSQDSKDFFMKVLEYLDELHIPYVLQPTLVRGLDYYCDTVYEYYVEGSDHTSQGALGGGGRYDALIEQLGGRESTPASGFGLGLERCVLAMKAAQKEGKKVVTQEKPTIFFAQLGEMARRKALRIFEELRRDGVYVMSTLSKGSLRAQLELADSMNVTHTAILGQKEVQDNTIIIRDMATGMQEIIDQSTLTKHLQNILKK